jgi:plastocyanin
VEEALGSDAKKIAFTATKVGKYPFYCSKKLPFLASHRERGMEGVLEVVP